MFGILWNRISAWRFTILLTAIVTLLLAATLLDPNENVVGFNALRLASTFVVLSAVLASTDRIRHRLLIAVLVIGWLVAAWLESNEFRPIQDAVQVVIFFYLAVLITRHVVSTRIVSADAVSGGIAIYFCLALAWAFSYRLLDGLSPGAFSQSLVEDFSAPLYLSLTTITTLGYGDISPVAPFARLWATLEAVVGLLYVAILISRLVSEFRR
ncbi:MAG: ion channel [Alphaproteobacteria bacterium]|nr:ion channel [Alphaproteobacteria bacterium]